MNADRAPAQMGVVRANPISAAGAVLRWGVAGSVETTRWTIGASVRATRFVAGAIVSGQTPREMRAAVMRELRMLMALPPDDPGRQQISAPIAEHLDLHARGDLSLPSMMGALLEASASVDFSYQGHPAYYRLLNELVPDEARVLRLLAVEGPQAALDVRTKRLFGAGSELLAAGITMIAGYAGLADQERVPQYLNNLERLGLIWLSPEMLPNEEVYHLLEAQPEVLERFKGVKIDTIPRSVELTPFGKDLCRICGLLAWESTASTSE